MGARRAKFPPDAGSGRRAPAPLHGQPVRRYPKGDFGDRGRGQAGGPAGGDPPARARDGGAGRPAAGRGEADGCGAAGA